MSNTTIGTWGKGDKVMRYKINLLLIYLGSVSIFINNTAIPCIFIPFSAEKYKLYFIYVK